MSNLVKGRAGPEFNNDAIIEKLWNTMCLNSALCSALLCVVGVALRVVAARSTFYAPRYLPKYWLPDWIMGMAWAPQGPLRVECARPRGHGGAGTWGGNVFPV